MNTNTSNTPAPASPPMASGTGPGAQAITPHASIIPPPEPMAVIVITIRRDSIEQHARLVMGGTHSANRSWQRTGAGSWNTHDAEFIEAEDRIGLELAEYMDALDLPNRVASMLPRPATPAVMAEALKAVREVGHD